MARSVKGILIDPFMRIIKEVNINIVNDSGIHDIYKFLNCSMFCTAPGLPPPNALFVDDEGLYRPPTNQIHQAFFLTNWYPQPLAGYGLILGSDNEGETTDTTLSVMDVSDNLTAWLSTSDVMGLY